jgi:hypothetical protein
MSPSFRLLPALAVAALAAFPACFLQWGSGEMELGTPKIEVTLTLDKPSYGLGEPLIATVGVKNVGDKIAVLPYPGRETCELYVRPAGSGGEELRLAEFVSAPNDLISFENVDPDESIERRLVAHRFTREPGEYEIFARYRTDVAEISSIGEAASVPQPVTVTSERVFERDREGRITEEAAIALARSFFSATPEAKAEAWLARDDEKLDVWLVTIVTADIDGKPLEKSCLISPYLGKVRREVPTTVAAERAKGR